MKHIMNNFYHFDSALSLGITTYLFVRWSLIIVNFGHVLYSLSLVLLLVGCLSVFIIDWMLYHKKKKFFLQCLFSVFQIILYGTLVVGLILLSIGVLYIGFFLSLMLLLSKGVRLVQTLQTYRQCRKVGRSTGISFNSKKRKILVVLLIGLFVFPLMIFGLGATSHTVARKEIDINHIIGEDQGSQGIQLSFYAKLSSYNYLTNETILRALNGTDFGGGNLNPVEILLLVEEGELLNPSNALKLAEMVNKCTESGLNVWIWFIYNASIGIYPSYQNYQHLPQFKQVFDNWVQTYSLSIHGMLFDNEIDQVISDADLTDVFSYLKTLLKHRRAAREDWSNAVNIYEAVANNWSAQGYKIALVGMDLAVLDVIDDDADLQQLFGIVDIPPNMWERMSFMLYRGCGTQVAPRDRDYLYNLADMHKELHGERAVAALGCMDHEIYNNIDEILKDIAILKYLNYSTVELFDFRGFYNGFGYGGLIAILNSTLNGWKYPAFQVNFHTVEYFTWSALCFADILLDFF